MKPSPSLGKSTASSLYSNGYPKVKTALSMGKDDDVKFF